MSNHNPFDYRPGRDPYFKYKTDYDTQTWVHHTYNCLMYVLHWLEYYCHKLPYIGPVLYMLLGLTYIVCVVWPFGILFGRRLNHD